MIERASGTMDRLEEELRMVAETISILENVLMWFWASTPQIFQRSLQERLASGGRGARPHLLSMDALNELHLRTMVSLKKIIIILAMP